MLVNKPELRLIEGGKQSSANPDTKKKFVIFDAVDLSDSFDAHDIGAGYKLLKDGKVRRCEVRAYNPKSFEQQLYGVVEGGNRQKLYRVKVTAIAGEDDIIDHGVIIDGECSCPEEVDCCHAAAIILDALATHRHKLVGRPDVSTYDLLQQQSKQSYQERQRGSDTLAQWSQALATFQEASAKRSETEKNAVVYLLNITSYRHHVRLDIKLGSAKRLKKGGYGKSRELMLDSTVAKSVITPEDKHILNHLYAAQHDPEMSRSSFHFILQNCDALIESMLVTGRAYWEVTSRYPLRKGESRTLEARWSIQPTGEQTLVVYEPSKDAPTALVLLPTTPIWYYDSVTHTLGSVKTVIPDDALIWLLQMPPIKPTLIAQTQKQLKDLLPQASQQLPALQTISHAPVTKNTQPQVILRLYGKERDSNMYEIASSLLQSQNFFNLDSVDANFDLSTSTMALAECQFNYQGYTVTLAQPEDKFDYFSEGQLHTVVRNRDYERQCIEKLGVCDLQPVALDLRLVVQDKELQFSFIIAGSDQDETLLAEQLSALQLLADKEGWRIHLEDSFPARVVHEVDDWYTELEENSSGIDWFGINLGVVVDGERINILPLLLEKIHTQFRDLDMKAISALADDTLCELKMENGQYLKVPFPRLRNILLVLCELFAEKPLDDSGKLRLSRLKASLIPEIEKAVGATRLRWFGATRLKKFGEKLATFNGIKIVQPPKQFNATLRPYQQDGLNWLQFLREFELNGILADEMGLGKTIQILAHLCVEKQAKRLKGPSLLIAPTSLMTNWSQEVERFAPHLKILILHGAKRKTQFEHIQKADIVLSTYPLVLRDKEALQKHDYHYLILDEAHQIKNSQAKVTQIILQMQAKRRLCLTGTPMENHLGELWSLFHFILPGLLGTKTQFTHIFRTPIEKQGDATRHQQLIQRIKPFMLRRRKDEVLQDLPEKTEIIRTVELSVEQIDLYESVRLAMEKKVRKVVDEQGLNCSQIIILDALLKLRQICCAPSLLKLAQAKKVKQSAKLEDLMTFLPSLIEEGRRILLFSSFTSMLTLIENRLKQQKIPYVKLTGKTRDRKTPINQFQQKEVPLFLISLKAGGIGLNLTSADTVIHYDPWWNPAAEQQATDRAHRIGQKNPVFVYKMIVEGTVEERILEMQSKKKEIIDGVLDSSKQTKLQLTRSDLDALFKPLA